MSEQEVNLDEFFNDLPEGEILVIVRDPDSKGQIHWRATPGFGPYFLAMFVNPDSAYFESFYPNVSPNMLKALVGHLNVVSDLEIAQGYAQFKQRVAQGGILVPKRNMPPNLKH